MFRSVGKNLEKQPYASGYCHLHDRLSDVRTQMVFQSLDDICCQFDLSKPIWLIPILQTSNATINTV